MKLNMRILLFFTNSEVSEMLSFAMESKAGVTVELFQKEKDFLTEIQENDKKIDLIVCEHNLNFLAAMSAVLKAKNLKSRIVICTDEELKPPVKIHELNIIGVAKNSSLLDDLNMFLEKMIEMKEEEVGGSEDSRKYCRIRTNLLVKVSPLEAGIFICLSPTHFVKLFKKGDIFDGDDLEKYAKKKNVEFMYVEPDDANIFIKKLKNILVELLNQDPIDEKTATETIEETVETTHQLVQQIGVTAEVEELIQTNVQLALKTMGEFPELNKVLQRMQTNPKRYIANHSTTLASVACAMAVAVDWYSDTTFEKLTIAAYLHDVGLTNEELCAVKDLNEFSDKYKDKFSTKEVQEYKSHPVRGANYINQFKEISAEVDKIILQHHEHPYGTGFPDQLKVANITPLSALFIVAHDFVDYVIENSTSFDMEEFLLAYQDKYKGGNFKKVFQAIVNEVL